MCEIHQRKYVLLNKEREVCCENEDEMYYFPLRVEFRLVAFTHFEYFPTYQDMEQSFKNVLPVHTKCIWRRETS